MSDMMITMLVLLAAELLLLLLVLLSVAWFRGRAARRRDERAIRLLVTRVRNSRAERETGIECFLDERMGLSGTELEQAKKAILQSELVLLKRFAEVYRGRDADAAARFDADLVTALAPYHELKADNVVVASEAAPADNSELEKLREQNQLLSDELSGNMETMSKMVREFSTLLAGSSGDAAAATAAATTEPSTDPAAETVPVAGPSEAPASDSPDRPADTAPTTGVDDDVGGAVQPDSAAESEPVAADESAEPDLGTAASVDTLFAEANAAAQAQALPESAHTDPSAAEPETPVQIEAGDDLEEVAERLEEEGPVEVVTFDDPDEFDVEVAASETKGSESFITTPTPEEASDAEESEILAAVQAKDGDVPDPGPVAEADAAGMDENFNADEEAPLKAQSQG